MYAKSFSSFIIIEAVAYLCTAYLKQNLLLLFYFANHFAATSSASPSSFYVTFVSPGQIILNYVRNKQQSCCVGCRRIYASAAKLILACRMIKLCSRCFERFSPFCAVYILKGDTYARIQKLYTKITSDICLAQSMTDATKFFAVAADARVIIISREINHCRHKICINNVTVIRINHTRRSIFYLQCMLFTSSPPPFFEVDRKKM